VVSNEWSKSQQRYEAKSNQKMAACVWFVVLLLSCVKVCENLSSPEVDLDSYIPQSVWDKWITVLFVGILMSFIHLVWCVLIGISACFVCN